MKILFISPYIPYPPITGGKVRVLNLLDNLKDKHQIILLCLLKSPKELRDIPMVEKYAYKVVPVLRRKAWSLTNLLRASFTRYPFLTVVNNFSKETEQSILKIMREEKPDILHAETFYMSQSILSVKSQIKAPMLLSKVDVEAQVYFRNARTIKNPLLKLIGFWDAHKMIGYEVDVCRYFDYITCASDVDRKLLERYFRKRGIKKSIDLLPNGVDVSYYHPGRSSNKFKSPTVIFVGNFRYFANTDAAFYFVKNSWDIVKEVIPEARLLVVGPRLTKGIQSLLSDDVVKLKRDDIEVTGFVSEDKKLEFLERSWVSVAPIRIGSGTKLKILEAMSMGLPVVATPIGIEGIDAVDGESVLVSDDPKAFAQFVIRLLKSSEERSKIGQAGRDLVEKLYDWKMIAKRLDKIYLALGNHGEN